MKKILTSFGGVEQGKNRHTQSSNAQRDYTAEVKRLFESAKPYGFSGFWEYNNEWLKQSSYYQSYARKVLDEPSFGWAFKPIVIFDSLLMMDEGDCLLWVDSNDILISDPQPLFDIAMKQGFYIHDHYPTAYLNKAWTNKDMFVATGCDTVEYHNKEQVQVNIMAFCKRERVVDIVEEWVMNAIDYNTMISNRMANEDGFVEHRHEQSLMTILSQKYKISVSKGYPYSVAHEKTALCIQ